MIDLRTTLLAGLALLAGQSQVASAAGAGCDARCLRANMDSYLEHLQRHDPKGLRLTADAIVRENTMPVAVGEGVWKVARAVRSRQDFPDTVTGQIWSWVGMELDGNRIAQLTVRLRVVPKGIAEIETLVNTGLDSEGSGPSVYAGGPLLRENVLEPDVLFMAPVPRERQASREELIKLANGYFEALGTSDAGAVKFGVRCERFESGAGGGINLGGPRRGGGPGAAAGGAPTPAAAPVVPRTNVAPNGYSGGASQCGGSMAGARQTTIERRFPVAIPELGVVIGYMFIMHHERMPPQDNFVNEIFKVVDGKIRQIDGVTFNLPAPVRSGFAADLPDPGLIRSMPIEMTRAMYPVAQPSAAIATARMGGGGPQLVADMPKSPYAGITEVRELVYGPDPLQRLDIFAPSDKSARPRDVLVFVHGGGWRGGDKHAAGDDLYENVVLWAAKQGMVGVNINYRLADYVNGRNLYPVGEQDVAAAIDWVHAHVAHWGGNPQRIFLWGHSAGASHVASYASNPAIHGRDPLVKGIFLLSSPLDMTLDFDAGSPVPYYGATRELAAEHSPLATLKKSTVPVLMGYSADETGLVPKHFEVARQALCEQGHCPTTVLTKGTHQGEMQAVGTEDYLATDALLRFMSAVH